MLPSNLYASQAIYELNRVWFDPQVFLLFVPVNPPIPPLVLGANTTAARQLADVLNIVA